MTSWKPPCNASWTWLGDQSLTRTKFEEVVWCRKSSPCARNEKSGIFTWITGWWFGCHVLFSQKYWVANHPNWRIFFRGVFPQPPTSEFYLQPLQPDIMNYHAGCCWMYHDDPVGTSMSWIPPWRCRSDPVPVFGCANVRVSWVNGGTQKWMVYFMENPVWKWTIWGYSPSISQKYPSWSSCSFLGQSWMGRN